MPDELVWASVNWPVAAFLTEILALGTAAPEGPVAVPDKTAPATCARNGTTVSKVSTKTPVPARNFAAFSFTFILLLTFNVPLDASARVPVSKRFAMLNSEQ